VRVILPVFFLLISGTTLAHEGGAIPADVWSHWNMNPLILAGILLPIYLYLHGAMRYPVARWRTATFMGGMLALFLALISPLDAVSGSLFSAHMLQHLLLVLVAAPLLVLSRPISLLLRGMPVGLRRKIGRFSHAPLSQSLRQRLTQPVTITIVHIAGIWLWHIPAFYSAALNNDFFHVLEHASFFITAGLYWSMIASTDDYGVRVISVFVVMMLTGLPGALMTFSGSPWYPDHTPYVSAWGLTPLEDQQLAGLMMWVPSGMVYALTAVLLFGAWLTSVEHRTDERERRLMRKSSDA
jgi:putative membrane protein